MSVSSTEGIENLQNGLKDILETFVSYPASLASEFTTPGVFLETVREMITDEGGDPDHPGTLCRFRSDVVQSQAILATSAAGHVQKCSDAITSYIAEGVPLTKLYHVFVARKSAEAALETVQDLLSTTKMPWKLKEEWNPKSDQSLPKSVSSALGAHFTQETSDWSAEQQIQLLHALRDKQPQWAVESQQEMQSDPGE